MSLDPVFMYGPLTPVDGAKGLFGSICNQNRDQTVLHAYNLEAGYDLSRSGDEPLPVVLHWDREIESMEGLHRHQ